MKADGVSPLRDLLGGGPARRLARATARLVAGFPEPPAGAPSDRAIHAYGTALRLALRVDTAQAEQLFLRYDHRIPAERYPLTAADEHRLTGADRPAATVVFEVATRLGLPRAQRRGRDRLAELLTGAASIVRAFDRWRALGVLDRDVVTRVLRGHTFRDFAEDEPLWRRFFEQLPPELVPELFEVRRFLGHGAAAVRLAGTREQERQAVAVCLASAEIDDVAAGLALARERGDAVTALCGRLADLLSGAGRYAEALGLFAEALVTCPPGPDERIDGLVDRFVAGVHRLIEEEDFAEAARHLQQVLDHGEHAGHRAALADLRATLLGVTRRHFGERLRHGGDRREVLRAWSRVEEAAGEHALAAARAEDGGDFFRAHQLFRRDGRFGEAVRVLRDDDTPAALAARAEACEAGGDAAGAAALYDRVGQLERAVPLYLAAGWFAAAADCLVRRLGDAAADDVRLAECLRKTGDHDELVRRCLTAVEARGTESPAADVLRGLVGDGLVPPDLTTRVTEALDALGARERARFEERAQVWVAEARAEVDARYSGIWGFDLGTTTCAAAVYDTRTRQPVFCPWKGEMHFASTVSLDRDGNELVGLHGEETLVPWLVGHIDAAKRKMGRSTVFKVRDRTFRPEEVAARLVRHARGLVETFLAGRVRERVAELAAVELAGVRPEWLSWAEQHHDLRLPRPRVVVTIPAYFTNNQKAATRAACRIAGVDLVRLIHEPTAACVTAARERRLGGAIAVVDLGAGTLDLSLLDVGENVYDVREVGGDSRFGGKDFDAAITTALAGRLERLGVPVAVSGSMRRRLAIAAERLKVELSAREHAECELRGLGEGDVRLELTRAELAGILAGQLAHLHEVCAGFSSSVATRPEYLVLVGRPMFSPMVRETVERAFGLRRTVVSDPRTAVAGGAALLGAMRDGSLDDIVLLDVTPLSLGIRVRDEHDRERLSELVPRNTTIPVTRSDVFTTHDDNQSVVRIEIFNGGLDREAKIGQFQLAGIPPAEKGVPQIDVTFEIDASCVLSVTARDRATGRAGSIRIADTTLLSPKEIAELTRSYDRQREIEQQHEELACLRDRLRALAASTMDDDSDAAWQEFRHRQGSHVPVSGADDADTRLLVEMFGQAGQAELDLRLAREWVREAAVAALNHVDRPGGALDADFAETTRLTGELTTRITGLRDLTRKIARWNAVLVRLALAEPDPLRRFRTHYAAGDYRQALAALDAPPSAADDRRRYARCLAETGDADGYREFRRAEPGPPGDPASALVRVQAGAESRAGFLLSDRVVVTGGTKFAADTVVTTGQGTRSVTRIHLPDSPEHDVAVLRLAEPVEADPLPLGYPALARVGDLLRTPDGGTGLVDRFGTAAGARLFHVGLRVPAAGVGGPVLDELGEVVGVVVATEAGGARVLGIDALGSLLAEAGLDRP
ncbi:Hsp70 family protein [Amycolatopsis sp. lyj-346]|uniref:Hsp70 family protein n=1 Tax=Amycolatopsis sp. lyj-346 TaxID=2789289 RepID=UPI0039796CAD